MKILHYIPSIDRTSGGVGAYMQLLTTELGKLVELHVVTHREANPLTLENCTVHYIPKNNNPFSNKGKTEFLTLLNDIKPDVFHANSCWLPMSAYTAMWARNAGYHVVYTPHGMLEPWIMKRHYWTKKFPASLLFQKRGIQIANVIHATAESEKHNLTQLGWNNNIEVIPNCVEIDKITMKESWIRNKNILFLSRVHVKKGINFLIEATANLKTELQGYTINIAGEGEESYINELKQLASKLGVENLIHFIGGVYGDKKWELFKKADLFVLPTHSENFGIVVAEALACGTPVITTQGTPWQELESYHCGWWTEIGTEATTKALKEFLQCTETQLEQMGKNGRKLIEEKYSSQKVAQDMVELYKKSLSINMELNIAENRNHLNYSKWIYVKRILWTFGKFFFRNSPRIAFGYRNTILRLFGAKIGKHVHIYSSTVIWFPWNLEIGDWSAIGEETLIYNLGKVTIGEKATVSHRVHVCAGTHDYTDPALPLLRPEIRIGNQTWICANTFIGPDIEIGEGAVIGAGTVMVKDAEPWGVYAGNPAKYIKKRILKK